MGKKFFLLHEKTIITTDVLPSDVTSKTAFSGNYTLFLSAHFKQVNAGNICNMEKKVFKIVERNGDILQNQI